MYCIALYYTYKRVNVSINKKSCKCIHNSEVFSFYIPPKCCKEKEPKDEQLCIAVHNNIHDADSLDNLSITE